MKTLLTGAFKYSEVQLVQLENLGCEITFVQDERVKLDIDVSEFECVVCNSLFQYNKIELFENLKVIQLTSVGYDRAPMEYINENRIHIFNAGDTYSVPMAEWVVLKILEVYKKSAFFIENQKKQSWIKEHNIRELQYNDVLIVGFGNVGKEIAKRLRGFNINIMAVDKKVTESISDIKIADIGELEDLIPKFDIVILSLPLTQETRHLFNFELISKMKEKSLLINVARGEIINQEDLLKVLESKKSIDVVLDVFNEEPLRKGSPLWSHEKVHITPHMSYGSDRNTERLFNIIEGNIKNGAIL